MPILILMLTFTWPTFSLGVVEFAATVATVSAFALADLRTNRGRAIAAETFWAGFFAINIGADAHSALHFILDVAEFLGGTALIVWLLLRAESVDTHEAQIAPCP